MKQIYLLNVSSNVYQFEAEEKQKFLQNVLDSLDINYSNLFKDDSGETKIKLKILLEKYNIKIVDEEDYFIYVEKDLVAKMQKPIYKIKKDLLSLDRKNVYMEAEIDFWTIFDEDK